MNKRLTSSFLLTFLNQRKEENNRRYSIFTKVWDQAGIEIATPGSAVGLATDCATGPDGLQCVIDVYSNIKETSDVHGTVSFDQVKMLQQK